MVSSGFRSIKQRVLWSLMIIAVASGCGKAGDQPTSTPDQQSIQTVEALFAQPTRAARPTPTITPVNDIELELNRVIALMEQAVLAQDIDTYLRYISPADPVFLAEHTRWAQDWVDHPLSVFTIDLFSIRSAGPNTVQARMTLRWSRRETNAAGSAGGATVSVVFFRAGESWQWGGEDWATRDAEGLRLYFFQDSSTDNRRQANSLMSILPGILTGLKLEFDIVPEHPALIRLYDTVVTLHTLTRISQPQIASWNEPGAAIKIALDQNGQPPTEMALANHLTRFLLYEMAGGTPGALPWWLEEGIAAYGEAEYRPLSQRSRLIKRIAALALDTTTNPPPLIPWDSFGPRPAWDDPGRQPAANQAYTLIAFITEALGAEPRNAWIRALAAGQPLEQACVDQLGLTFDELDSQWREWLVMQL